MARHGGARESASALAFLLLVASGARAYDGGGYYSRPVRARIVSPPGPALDGDAAEAAKVARRAAAAPADDVPQRTRRQVLWIGARAAAAVAMSPAIGPLQALAYDPTLTLERSVYLILRVQEATQQETRLVTTGKFKDLQRANIKAAAKMMLRNYQLDDCVIKAATGVKDKSKVQEASDAGSAAVDALNQINEYFDASDTSLQVNFVAPDKLKFIVKALKTCSDSIDRFLGYLPPSLVEATKAQIEEENNLNKIEYKAPDGSAEYLNPAPESSQRKAAAASSDPTAGASNPPPPPPAALVPSVEQNSAPSPAVKPPTMATLDAQTKDEIAELELKLDKLKRLKEAAAAN